MPSYTPNNKAVYSAQTAVKACNEIVKNMEILMQTKRQLTDGQLDMSQFDSLQLSEKYNCDHFDVSIFTDMLNQIEDIHMNRMSFIRQISNNKI